MHSIMSASKEQQANRRKEVNEDIDYVLHNLWNISRHSSFCKSFKRNIRFMSDMTMQLKLSHDHEIIENFKASKSELRKMRTLCFYSFYLFNENKPLKRYSSITKKDYEIFKSQPHLWKSLDKDHQVILQPYLNSPIPEIIELTVELPRLKDPIFLSTIPSFEHERTANIDEEGSGKSFEPVQEHDSSQPITSNKEQPTLNSVFHQIMIGSNIEPHDKKVETSSENKEIHPVFPELSHSSHSSNGEGDSLECSSHFSNGKEGSLEPYRDSSSFMGGPPDPHRDSSLPVGVYLTHFLHLHMLNYVIRNIIVHLLLNLILTSTKRHSKATSRMQLCT